MEINKKKRLLNFIIDSILIGFLINLILYFSYYLNSIDSIENTKQERKYLFLLCLTVYYLLSELVFGRTIGKFFTNTKVVDINGNKPTTIQIFIRSLSRLIPFDIISYLGWGSRGLHDYLSKTKLISIK
jgi:uncharacterized RDD family membrane protein YckC